MGALFTEHSLAFKQLKKEDTYIVFEPTTAQPYHVFGVFDGHAGDTAPILCRDNLLALLKKSMPTQPTPDPSDRHQLMKYASEVRLALLKSFIALNDAIGQASNGSGTTAVVFVVTGHLITVANTGDSEGFVDTGEAVIPMTRSFRVGVDLREKARMEQGGVLIRRLNLDMQGPAQANAPGVGPERLWPPQGWVGGLMMSRTLGDLDGGPWILPHPHIKQVIVPKDGCRLALGSDGIWDQVSGGYALPQLRSTAIKSAGPRLLNLALKHIHPTDDMTAIVVDLMPSQEAVFKGLAKSSGGGGFLACCAGGSADIHRDPSVHLNAVDMVWDDDMYPVAQEMGIMTAAARQMLKQKSVKIDDLALLPVKDQEATLQTA